MIDPRREQQLTEAAAVELCTEILRTARNELYVHRHFLDLALSSLRFEAAGTASLAVDGMSLKYQPDYLMQLYTRGRVTVNRAYLHMVLHCLFGHLWHRGEREPALWQLACDIAAEYLIDRQALSCLHVPLPAAKREMYLRLEKQGVQIFSAELIYHRLAAWELDERRLYRLLALFAVDEHSGWDEPSQRAASQQLQQQWQERREQMQTAMETGDKEPSDADKDLRESLSAANRERYDYRKFLRKFAVLREENGIDADSFDPIFYTWGLERYGNLPLVEPLETREHFAIEDFVLVIDTSMSTKGPLVKRFLEECCDVLSESGSYFRKVNLHILQCDDQVREDKMIQSTEELRAYMENFTLHGGGGTDFRPAFDYVAGLIKQQRFHKLKGLLYFTDGKGIYPLRRTPYDTAFVFVEDNYEDIAVPPWAMKLILLEHELEERYSEHRESKAGN